jgi:thiamine-monophosphate kinase
MTNIIENEFINSIAGKFNRSPIQINKLHESDAEIIKVSGNKNLLAITTDTIAEEIQSGLYDDPYLMGWMIITVNLSDLAAVCAEPIGLVISEIIPLDFNNRSLKSLNKGINDACNYYNTFILGGDTSQGGYLILTATALGEISGEKVLIRKKCQPGEILFISGKAGRGNSFALSKFLNTEQIKYKPVARLKESKILKQFATCCMDTSDGLISTVDQISRLNDVGVEFSDDWLNLLDEDSRYVAEKLNFPLWLLLAGQHGEFELVFTVAENLVDAFIKEAHKQDWNPYQVGKITRPTSIRIKLYNRFINLNTAKIRNLLFEVNGDVKKYINELLKIDSKIRHFQ